MYPFHITEHKHTASLLPGSTLPSAHLCGTESSVNPPQTTSARKEAVSGLCNEADNACKAAMRAFKRTLSTPQDTKKILLPCWQTARCLPRICAAQNHPSSRHMIAPTQKEAVSGLCNEADNARKAAMRAIKRCVSFPHHRTQTYCFPAAKQHSAFRAFMRRRKRLDEHPLSPS